MQTEKFTITLGTQPGYVGLSPGLPSLTALHEAWEQISARCQTAYGFPLTAVVMAGNALYSPARGCPLGGEPVLIISGVRNPELVQSKRDWEAAVAAAAQELLQAFQQQRVYLEFAPVEFLYLKADAHA